MMGGPPCPAWLTVSTKWGEKHYTQGKGKKRKSRPVKVTDKLTGQVTVYADSSDAGDVLSVSREHVQLYICNKSLIKKRYRVEYTLPVELNHAGPADYLSGISSP